MAKTRGHFAVLCILASAGAAWAQPVPGTIGIDLRSVADGMVAPIFGTHAGDGSGRFFIVDQTGKIFILQNGEILPTPFLDLSSEIVTVNTAFDERGLLGLAFHPQYEFNGRFFVRYSKARQGSMGEPCFGTSRGCHEEILAEYGVSGTSPNVASPIGRILFRVDEPEFNHNGGDVAFGPDGFLYFTLGDGGGANDGLHLPTLPHGPIGNGQNIETPLGAILRIDVDNGDPYAIPPTNPFANETGVDEIYAYGLRNPYRFSFDTAPGPAKMYLTDVGQNLKEELNLGQLGANYGWAIMEGTNCFDPLNPSTPGTGCNMTGLTLPIVDYGRAFGISIIGGYVYRGSTIPDLFGHYVFGDFSTSFGTPNGHLFYLDETVFPAQMKFLRIGTEDRPLGRFVKGFGQDEDGEIYVMTSSVGGPSGGSGQVLKITACYANCDGSTIEPILNVADFHCFFQHFATGSPAANCDLSTTPPTLNVADFACFVQRFAGGCP